MILKKRCGVHALRIAVGMTMLGLLLAGSANAANLTVCPSGCAYSNILKAIYTSSNGNRNFDGIGIYNREVVWEVDSPLIKYQVIQSTPKLIDYQESSNVIFNNNEAIWSKTKSKWTDIAYTNPNGKLFWVLTTSFMNRKWVWSESVAEKEYKSVKPYVNVIMSYPYGNMDTRTDSYPKYLLKFYNNN